MTKKHNFDDKYYLYKRCQDYIIHLPVDQVPNLWIARSLLHHYPCVSGQTRQEVDEKEKQVLEFLKQVESEFQDKH